MAEDGKTEYAGSGIPNAETTEAIRQARAGDGLTEYASVDELMAEFE